VELALSLISTGDRHAVASRGRRALQGRWCWWLKDRIDRNFVWRFSRLPDMSTGDSEVLELAPMRCGGCGSKVGSEMARASGCAVEILVDRLPLYPGAAALARQGIESSLLPQNIRIRHSIDDARNLASHAAYPVMFDPQTAGGMLASVATEGATQCLQALRDLGYGQAQIVARAVERSHPDKSLSLVSS